MEGDPMVSQGAPGPRGQTETHPASGFVAPAWASVAQFRTRNFAQMKVQSGSYVFVVCACAVQRFLTGARLPSFKQGGVSRVVTRRGVGVEGVQTDFKGGTEPSTV